MTYEEAQQLKAGDKVLVTKSAPSGSICTASGIQWTNAWNTHMDTFIGKAHMVTEYVFNTGGVSLGTNGSFNFCFPWWCLEKVTDDEVDLSTPAGRLQALLDEYKLRYSGMAGKGTYLFIDPNGCIMVNNGTEVFKAKTYLIDLTNTELEWFIYKEPETLELTLEEVAKKFDVKAVKIVDKK